MSENWNPMRAGGSGIPPSSHGHLYNSLSLRQIRLLHFQNRSETLKDQYGQPILRFSFEVTSIEETQKRETSYCALSYVWGVPEPLRVIEVNGHLMGIRSNLYAALSRLAEEIRTFGNNLPWNGLWVDALCINQSDLAERSQQVQMMGDVFSAAALLAIWLGSYEKPEPSDDQEAAWRELFWRDLSRGWLSRWLNDRRKSRIEAELERFEWFHRIWTLQEICLAKAAVILCGPFVVRWETLVQILGNRGDNVISNIERCREQSGSMSLVGLINKTWSREASVPHDKIYGLLGLCTSGTRARINVDYTLDLRHFNLNVTMAFVAEERSLSFLRIVERRFADMDFDYMSSGRESTSRVTEEAIYRFNTAISCIPQWHNLRNDCSKSHFDKLMLGSEISYQSDITGLRYKILPSNVNELGSIKRVIRYNRLMLRTHDLRVETWQACLLVHGSLVGFFERNWGLDGDSRDLMLIRRLPKCILPASGQGSLPEPNVNEIETYLRDTWQDLSAHCTGTCDCVLNENYGLLSVAVNEEPRGFICELDGANDVQYLIQPGCAETNTEGMFSIVGIHVMGTEEQEQLGTSNPNRFPIQLSLL